MDPNETLSLWVEIETGAISRNVTKLRALLTPATRLLAVVKANAYGHGDVAAALAAIEGGATWLGVARVEEGEALRRAGIEVPILLLAEPQIGTVGRAVEAGLVPTIYTRRIAQAFASASGERYPVHVKVDTGMHRYGVLPKDLKALIDEIDGTSRLQIQGICSHFAVAEDVMNPTTQRQFEIFMQVLADLGSRADEMIKHMANSAATLTFPDAHLDMVRPGISIYGIPPSVALAGIVELEPALSLKSRIGFVKRLDAGEAISYGQRYRLDADSTVATVPCGYADGLRRALTNLGQVLIGGKRYTISGTVTMDHFLVDVGNNAVEVGDEVVIIGRQGAQEISAHEVASMLDTIPYEIVCGISARVPRVVRT